MRVAPLTAADAPQYRRLMLHAYEHEADAFTSTVEERAALPESWWVQRIADPYGSSAAFGAFRESELVGTVALEFSRKAKTRHKVLLIGMYVLAEHRGAGAAKALVQAAIGHAKACPGARIMTLTVTDGNEPAIALYRTLGFRAFGTEPMAILTPSGFKAKVHMWRSLDGERTAA